MALFKNLTLNHFSLFEKRLDDRIKNECIFLLKMSIHNDFVLAQPIASELIKFDYSKIEDCLKAIRYLKSEEKVRKFKETDFCLSSLVGICKLEKTMKKNNTDHRVFVKHIKSFIDKYEYIKK